ncbi:CPBP family intramembrane glutamic endopeptidase [Pedobacter faecalis]|uniref:CPBP family intramembrane glutamic endopeptidase n=1 Tax=Pedobacter faecalis TaxID=3041495 RepID=UPI00254FB8C1|nr:CPBP family intramembrane glutamic endopeptidase [Pedobacter sp. ELA7]
MNFIQKDKAENTPYIQIVLLLAYALIGFVVSSVIAIAVLVGMYGMEMLTNPLLLTSGENEYLPGLRLLLIANSVGLFLFPPLLLSFTEKRSPYALYHFEPLQLRLFAMVFGIVLVSMPFMEWVAIANQKMVLPSFLQDLERWIRMKEDENMRTTLILLKMASVKDLLINLFMIALLPALAEELMFRGAVQRIFGRFFSNIHVAIWLSAILFSAIHVQFYGFVPRMLLGAAFGYLYFWSGSLWYAIVAHGLNNAYAVLAAWYMQQKNIPLSEDSVSTPQFTWYAYVVSFVLTIAAFRYFKKQAK